MLPHGEIFTSEKCLMPHPCITDSGLVAWCIEGVHGHVNCENPPLAYNHSVLEAEWQILDTSFRSCPLVEINRSFAAYYAGWLNTDTWKHDIWGKWEIKSKLLFSFKDGISKVCCGRKQLPTPPFSTIVVNCTNDRLEGTAACECALQKRQLAAFSLQLHMASQQLFPQQGSHKTHHFQWRPTFLDTHDVPLCTIYARC